MSKEFMDAGATVVAIVQLTGKSKQSNKSLDMTMYELCRMREGKAIECHSIV